MNLLEIYTVGVARSHCRRLLLDIVARLKRRKASGLDGIVSEHVIYGGDQLYVHLCMLFNALLAHSFVPSDVRA